MTSQPSAVHRADLSAVDTYASILNVDRTQHLVSGDSRQQEVGLVPRPCASSTAIDWLAGRARVSVTAWADPVIEAHGHSARSVYVETFWLPYLGPSATWALRRFAAWLEGVPRLEVELAEFGNELGLGAGIARNAPLIRTLGRLAQFGLAAPLADAWCVRRYVPSLPHRLAQRLPAQLAAQHAADRSHTNRTASC